MAGERGGRLGVFGGEGEALYRGGGEGEEKGAHGVCVEEGGRIMAKCS